MEDALVQDTAEQNLDPRLKSLAGLLQMERDIRQLHNRDQLKFMICNETHRLVPYDQAIFVVFPVSDSSQHDLQSVKVEAISSMSQVDNDAPLVAWLKSVIKHLIKTGDARNISEIKPDSIPLILRKEWFSWCPGQALWCPLISTSGIIQGGLWLLRKKTWLKSDITILDYLADAYTYSWEALAPQQSWRQVLYAHLSGRIKWFLLLFILLGFIPVRMSVLANAQVVARNPIVISAPMDGVIHEINITPNQEVTKGDVLFTLDDTNIRNKHAVANKALEVADANYLRATQQAFADARSKSELAILKAVLAEKQAEVDYYAEMLKRTQVIAEQSGVVIFDDINDWLGKPVVVGEKVMTLADIHDTWLEIWLPVDDAIALDQGAELRLFLNIDPVRSIKGVIQQTSYEATISPQDILAYRLKATFAADQQPPRLGLKGVAKVYSESVPLFYYIFRRPLAEARRWLGL
ncbi:HlyD family efflux transporter periplasmic adaptor subunit [Endozoicomonas sp. SM1973]|uniref:HlyD family efflux transporter periplasmic adaptor subunit n=1 Tax=Spartinivicinus marinus TaxID=2994442 RepID=A0A853IFA4_9GAMM|nr:HlyD family efflux transporter periplasmic adaptor subunit [Spartinivicinus marinus]MCX4029328.1 HlyD family efflux transporter periplasmic adaptor subunit [Spartinivicinus marinus]NYZ68167.1 HlyD family efflux transporter periplasmic adaptor subunit [Spartinivicinus marinus]